MLQYKQLIFNTADHCFDIRKLQNEIENKSFQIRRSNCLKAVSVFYPEKKLVQIRLVVFEKNATNSEKMNCVIFNIVNGTYSRILKQT